jgi:hypothetical protein
MRCFGSWGLALAVLSSVGCGGSVTQIPGEGGVDGGAEGGGARDAMPHADVKARDVGAPTDVSTGSEAMTTQPYDGTTGKPCTTDADCRSADGPEVARCSSSVFAPDEYYPTPVCILPTCSPVSDSTSVHYCDGPDEASSPGMCVPAGMAGAGQCLPKCAFDTSGDAPTGCQGKDTCFAYNSGPEAGYGYCWAGCTQDSDCESGQHCQADRGTCLAAVVPPTKTVGQACTQTDEDDDVCYCIYGGASETGYCTSFCIVGDASTCPGGFVCGADEDRASGYSMQNTGMAGRCHYQCSTTDGGLTCPAGANSTCSDIYAAGPYCIVP